ncbi:ent-copalyl diphosphate synthase 1-like isoform X2 [Tasmannia lanceolata]|uniref:ent-copalyl diphosphate synthase 1-like isoform X2 n=1 Tax=Tasmannia lanceolata TaxID=3420 RepID=UPI004064124C
MTFSLNFVRPSSPAAPIAPKLAYTGLPMAFNVVGYYRAGWKWADTRLPSPRCIPLPKPRVMQVVGYYRAGWKWADTRLPSPRCIPLPKPRVMQEKFQNGGLSIIEWPEALSKEEKEEALLKALESSKIRQQIDLVKAMLRDMGDGEISVSAYDTAWVALVEDIHGSGAPQFPSALEWIVKNQLIDGSWGDPYIFSAHDRIINTLACVIALESWKIYHKISKKGMSFLRENIGKLKDEIAEHMPIGFEVAFPCLIELSQSLGLEVPLDSSVLQDIYDKRNLKLQRIPKEMMHKVPTTLLHSLEGMPNLDWEKLLKLKNEDGSFLFSPSSTAFALMQTKDKKCLDYLQRAVERFKGGVPNVYPVDMFEHIWAVDRLERLGISRYFKPEIKGCLDYVHRYWTEDGICWARNSKVHDGDDTAMGFRLLRLHGYDISTEAFRHFKSGEEFFCFVGQANQAITGIYNLNRASQVMFPGEKILEDARSFSYKFLRQKQDSNQLLDKWIITKDLPGEVGYTLDFPWYASLPRVETRFYLEQYGGEDDVWIGKTLYRMPYVNNNSYLELAKSDFNNCQALHQLEWLEIEKWYEECNLGEFGLSKRAVLQAYFLAIASIFEPEKATERLAWARTAVLMEAVSSYFGSEANTPEQRRAFLEEFNDKRSGKKKTGKGLVWALLETLGHLSWESLVAHGRDVRYHLRQTWASWLNIMYEGTPGKDVGAELLVRTITLCAGRSGSEEFLSHPVYSRLASLSNSLCHKLRGIQKLKAQTKDMDDGNSWASAGAHPIESEMQEIVQCVLQDSEGFDCETKQTFLTVAKSFYYSAYCSPAAFDLHIAEVLFERVA